MGVCRSLRPADHSTRGVLPTVVRRCVWSRNIIIEETLAHWGAGELSPQIKIKKMNFFMITFRLQWWMRFKWRYFRYHGWLKLSSLHHNNPIRYKANIYQITCSFTPASNIIAIDSAVFVFAFNLFLTNYYYCLLIALAMSRNLHSLVSFCGPGSSVGITTGYGLDGTGIESWWGRNFPHLSRPALGPTQPPVQWVPGLSQR